MQRPPEGRKKIFLIIANSSWRRKIEIVKAKWRVRARAVVIIFLTFHNLSCDRTCPRARNVTPFTIDVKLTSWGSSYVSFKLRPHSSRRLNYFVAYSPVYRATWHKRRHMYGSRSNCDRYPATSAHNARIRHVPNDDPVRMNDPKGCPRWERGEIAPRNFSRCQKSTHCSRTSRVRHYTTRWVSCPAWDELVLPCLRMKKRERGRERERREVRSPDTRSSGRVVRQLQFRVARSFLSLPCPFSLLILRVLNGDKEIRRFLCAPSHFPSKLLPTLDAADSLGYTLRSITMLFIKLSLYFSHVIYYLNIELCISCRILAVLCTTFHLYLQIHSLIDSFIVHHDIFLLLNAINYYYDNFIFLHHQNYYVK